MRARNVAIGIVADRIDVLLCHGHRVIDGRRVAVALDPSPTQWGKTVRAAAKAVGDAATTMGGSGLPATVFYRSPTQCVDYTSLKMRSAHDARQAAILACADSLSCPLDMAVCESMIIGRASTAAGAHTHVVVAADHDESLASIVEMVDQADLKFVSASPIDALLLARWVRMALERKETRRGYLYVGDQKSFFVIAGNRCIDFARTISLGTDALSSSLTLPIRLSTSAEPVELSLETARGILHSFGFPNRSQIVHEEHQLTGAHVLPLLQPVLQRYMVELRQSLRFGLPDGERHSTEVFIAGPGSAIPNFAALLAHELKLTVKADEAYSEHDYEKPDSQGSELLDALAERRGIEALALRTQGLTRELQFARLRKWMWSGAAAALLLIGLDVVRLNDRLDDVRRQAAAVKSNSEGAKTLQSTAERLLSAISAMDKLEQKISTELGAVIDLRACLLELSKLTDEGVQLTNLQISNRERRVTAMVNGFSFDSPQQTGQVRLQAFIARLRESPLFEHVVLSNVQAGIVSEKAAQRFEASFDVLDLPPANVDSAAAGAPPSEPDAKTVAAKSAPESQP